MKVLIVSKMTNDELYDYIYNTRHNLHVDPDQKFFRNLVYGLAQNIDPSNITCISVPPVSAASHNKEIWDEDIFIQDEIKYIMPAFKNHTFSRFFDQRKNALRCVSEWLDETKNEKRAVICDPLICHVTNSIVKECKKNKCVAVAVVTDLPLLWLQMGKKKIFSLSYLFNFFYNHSADRGLSKFDGYVWLTEQMNSEKNKHNRPYIVIEGFADVNNVVVDTISEDLPKRFIMYAGGVYKVFKLVRILQAFCNANIPNLDFLIYGDGDDVNRVIEFEKINPHIHYMGVVSSNEIKVIEKKALLLVNPRPSLDEYTKYSFPSKTLEYMGSGTAMLSTKLQGIPKDYTEYLFWFDNESESGMTDKIKYIFSLSDSDIKHMGTKALDFIYSEKTANKQAEKIIKLINRINN